MGQYVSLQQHTQKVVSLQVRLAKHQQEMLDLQHRLRQVESQRNQIIDARLVSIQRERDTKQLKLRTLQKQRVKNRKQKEQLEETIKKLCQYNQQLESRQEVLGSENHSYQTQLISKKQKLQQTQDANKLIEKEYNLFKQQMEDILVYLEKLEQEKAALEEERNRLRENMQKVQRRDPREYLPEPLSKPNNAREDQVEFEDNISRKLVNSLNKTRKMDRSSILNSPERKSQQISK